MVFDPLSLRTIDDIPNDSALISDHSAHTQSFGAIDPDSSDDEDIVKKGKKSRALDPSFTFSSEISLPIASSKNWDFGLSRQALSAKALLRAQGKTSIDEKILKSLGTIDQDLATDVLALKNIDGVADDEVPDNVSGESDEEKTSDNDEALVNPYFDINEPEDIVKDKSKAEFFDLESDKPEHREITESFQSLQLSRPVLKSIAALGYVRPTDIQARAIPLALQGRDICGSAVTGSGKTAAFIIPIVERLLFRPKNDATTRVLILVPTRELGVQCQSVAISISKFTDISTCLCVGGLPTKTQEAELRLRPDIIIATPGRLIDHIHNSPSFFLDAIDILVIDEADRILDDGFDAELNEIIKHTPRTRQTMLFSATMTDNVDDLIKLSLNRPVRLFVDQNTKLTNRLVQEFIRVRGHKETSRPAILAALCSRTYTSETIVFFRSKAAAHHMKIIFGFLGLKAAELHGNLTQLQRLEALELFREKKVGFLLATDLASRGLDISGVKTVINYDMPKSYSIYVHRVGRTARGDLAGRAVSLVGEADRALLKMAIKNTRDAVKNRIVPANVVEKYEGILAKLKDSIKEIYIEEKEEKELSSAELQITRAQNILGHQDEIMSRPARTWFQSEKERTDSKDLDMESAQPEPLPNTVKRRFPNTDSKKSEHGPMDGLSRKKRRMKEAREEDKQVISAQRKSVKAVKAAARPKKISHVRDSTQHTTKQTGKGSSFAKEIYGGSKKGSLKRNK
ncbi:hypothetical protein BATDEDRAFT_34342 [Batrachochytrium dendrobatidis JAM81]|uniref:RNA helicase n=2 Tax=Batrachochytrium dendrobatidis TaxID=109871 RepID=F4NX46_BATDJ|nr:uncharacterized protein BATDEDRAFT_34342 [Batrachochytrium dendrobatidis JAM81]EGF82294.1 hypothetical protein BATDEDRAFT_34342 [Batrachochytrium dendrobatidis JAM81]OAJ40042.1 hypothetical protein BDEG_23821 [Batrachochytrium dendrobatidis JEL423]|eukprot:XP_006676762.1 hypothetical protein BATDEDRAFT_34342 [Batrachochytrium dendrobatidis JAM81]